MDDGVPGRMPLGRRSVTSPAKGELCEDRSTGMTLRLAVPLRGRPGDVSILTISMFIALLDAEWRMAVGAPALLNDASVCFGEGDTPFSPKMDVGDATSGFDVLIGLNLLRSSGCNRRGSVVDIVQWRQASLKLSGGPLLTCHNTTTK
jgi:hypothetical protein